MRVERRPTCALTNKPLRFEKCLIAFATYFRSYKKWCASSCFIIPSSSARLSAAFSAPLTAITHFTHTFLSKQQTVTTSYFRVTILGLVGKISSWLKINNGGGVQ